MKKFLETGVILSILLIFVMTGFSILVFGAKSYKLIGEDMAHNFNVRTPIAYLATKVRKNDRAGQIHIKPLEGVDALVLEEVIENITYENWIYAYRGMLREAYIQQGTPLSLEDGDSVIEVGDLALNWIEGSLKIELQTPDGVKEELLLTPRTPQKGENN